MVDPGNGFHDVFDLAGSLGRLSPEWLDRSSNPGMVELGLDSTDVFGGIVVVNFADRTWRSVLTGDFAGFRPVTAIDELTDLAWLDDS